MRIVIMDTGRGTNRATIDLWRERLSLEPDDTISLLTWQPPAEPLPVAEHLVFGPRFEPARREPRRSQTRFDIFDDADISDADMRADASTSQGSADDVDQAAEASLGDIELSEQMSEQMTDASVRRSPEIATPEADASDAAVDAAAAAQDDAAAAQDKAAGSRLTHLPWNHPARLKQAARWRLGKARRNARTLTRGVTRRGKNYVRHSDSAPARLAKRAVRLRGDGVATSFALSAMRSTDAAELFGAADVVVPVDARSQRAAWVLAQKIDGPDVVVTYPAAARVIAARRQGASGSRR